MNRGPDIFEWAKRQVQPQERTLSFKECLSVAMTQSPWSREQIADRMSATLRVAITKAQLDAWTAESKGAHRFPAEYLPSFCEACGSTVPLQHLARAAGLHLVSDQDKALAEVARLEAEERRLRTRRRLLQQLVEDVHE